MSTRFVLAPLLALALLLSAASSLAQPRLVQYTDPQGRFTVLHPQGWRVSLLLGRVVVVAQPGLNSACLFASLPRPVEAQSARELLDNAAKVIARLQPQAAPISQPHTIGSNPEVCVQRFELKRAKANNTAVLRAVRRGDGTGQFVFYFAPAGRFSELEPLLLRIARSVAIPEQANPTGSASEVRFVTYNDPAGEFTCAIPEGWQVTTLPGKIIVVSEDETQVVCALATARIRPNAPPAKRCAEEFLDLLKQLADEVVPAEEGVQVCHVPDIFAQALRVKRGNVTCAAQLTVQRYSDGTVQYYYYQADVQRFLDLEPILCRILSSVNTTGEVGK